MIFYLFVIVLICVWYDNHIVDTKEKLITKYMSSGLTFWQACMRADDEVNNFPIMRVRKNTIDFFKKIKEKIMNFFKEKKQ